MIVLSQNRQNLNLENPSLSLWIVKTFWSVNDNEQDERIYEECTQQSSTITVEQWKHLRDSLSKPLFLAAHYAVTTNEDAKTETLHWSALLFNSLIEENLPLSNQKRQRTGENQSSEEKSQPLGVAEDFNEFLYLIDSQDRGTAEILHEPQGAPVGCLILFFLAGTYRWEESQKTIEQWKARACDSRFVLAYVEAVERLDANLQADTLFDNLLSKYRIQGFRHVMIHVVTHSYQGHLDMPLANGRVLWWGNLSQTGAAQTVEDFLERLMYFASKIARVNLLITLACCDISLAVNSSPFLRHTIKTKFNRMSKVINLTLLFSTTPGLRLSMATEPRLWMPLYSEWIQSDSLESNILIGDDITISSLRVSFLDSQ